MPSWLAIVSNVLNLPAVVGPVFMVSLLTIHLLTGSSSGTVGQWGKLICHIQEVEGLATGLRGVWKYVRCALWGYPVIPALLVLCWIDSPGVQAYVLAAMMVHVGFGIIGAVLQVCLMKDTRSGHTTYVQDGILAVNLAVRLGFRTHDGLNIDDRHLGPLAVWGCVVAVLTIAIASNMLRQSLDNKFVLTIETIKHFDEVFEREGHSKGLIWPDGSKYPRGFIPAPALEKAAEAEVAQLTGGSRSKAA